MDVKVNNVASVPISASTLLKSCRIDHPKYIIKIRGEVLDIRRYPTDTSKKLICFYGDIGDSDGIIEFKIKPTKELKMVGQHIEILGTLSVKNFSSNRGIQLIFDGEMVCEYDVNVIPNITPFGYKVRGKLSLSQFIEKHGIEKLCLLSTATGADNFVSALYRGQLYRGQAYCITLILSLRA